MEKIKYKGKKFTNAIAKEDKPKKVKKKKILDFPRQVEIISTRKLYQIKYTRKELKHFFQYEDDDGNTKSLCWNFSAPMCISKNITLSRLRKMCDSLRNNFGVDITKDIKRKPTELDSKVSPLHQKYICRRNTLTKEMLISRISSCLFTIGIVKYKEGKFVVDVNDMEFFVNINNNYSYNKKKSFKQKICLELQVLRRLKNFHFEELTKLITSKNKYFHKVHLLPNNMYGHCVLTNVLTLSKVIPEKEAIQILYSLVDYKEKFSKQEEYYNDKFAENFANKTIRFVEAGLNKDPEEIEKSLLAVVNITNSRKLKKKSSLAKAVSKLVQIMNISYVSYDYLKENYYNKEEVNKKFISKEEVKNNYVTRKEYEELKKNM